ncbi:MAG TPA: hypothetical protein VGL68_03110 [Solirubrobacteraceae bacterium]|jgi:hypothetical protein
MGRLTRDWRALGPERRLAGGAALALFVTMLLPWYQQNAVVDEPRTAPLQSRNLNAFQVFSFVEAAVLLVAVAVLYLLYARSEGREFHLPGGDGAVVFTAGIWTALLLVLRLFDKPGINSHGIAANVGVQWGIFFALAAAGLLAYAGSRMRAAARPEPPLRRTRRPPAPSQPPAPRPQPQLPRAPEPRTQAPPELTTPPTPGSSAEPLQPRSQPSPQRVPPQPAARRPATATETTEQLSFEETPPKPE